MRHQVGVKLARAALATAVAVGGVAVAETVPQAQAQVLVPPGGLPAALSQIIAVLLLAGIPTLSILYYKYSDPEFVPQNASDERGVQWANDSSAAMQFTGDAAAQYAQEEQRKQEQQRQQAQRGQ